MTRFMNPTEAVLIKKSCDNLRYCPMHVAHQLITQSQIRHVLDVMDREEISEHQTQPLQENEGLTRAMMYSKQSGEAREIAPLPLVADCRSTQDAVGLLAPEAGTEPNAFIHRAVRTLRIAGDALPDSSPCPWLSSAPGAIWNSHLNDAIKSAKKWTHNPSKAEKSFRVDDSKRAALTEFEYARLCNQTSFQPQVTNGNIQEFLLRSYGGDEAQGLEGEPDPADSHPAVGDATMPTPSNSLNVPTPSIHSPHSQAGYIMGDLSQSNSAPTGTGQFSEGTTPGSTGLPSALLSNSSGQEPFSGSSSLLPPASEQSQMSDLPDDQAMAHQTASTAPAVPNQDSVAYDSPSNYLPMPFPGGQMQTMESPFQDNFTTSGQLYSVPNVPPADESGLQAQPLAGLHGPTHQTGVPAQSQYGYSIPQPGASAFTTQSPSNPDNLPPNDFGSFPNHGSDSFQDDLF